jgi:hypothetical protein
MTAIRAHHIQDVAENRSSLDRGYLAPAQGPLNLAGTRIKNFSVVLAHELKKRLFRIEMRGISVLPFHSTLITKPRALLERVPSHNLHKTLKTDLIPNNGCCMFAVTVAKDSM